MSQRPIQSICAPLFLKVISQPGDADVRYIRPVVGFLVDDISGVVDEENGCAVLDLVKRYGPSCTF